MPQDIQLTTTPKQAFTPQLLTKIVAQKLKIKQLKFEQIQVLKRSIDARHRNIKYQLRVRVWDKNEERTPLFLPKTYPNVKNAKRVIVIGCGPAGMFAALRLIELGLKPIILERGKNVRERRRDLAAINKEHIVNPESNYCFGEGGAGTYSDGKLYTRSGKKKDIKRILETFVENGADENILIDAHPHIGTNKLPKIIVAMREKIIELGGEIHFNTKVTDFTLGTRKIEAIIDQNGTKHEALAYILATGHSARDIFKLLQEKEIRLETKTFALGFRIEHPQHLIDSIQYNCDTRGEFLPPASYSLVQQINGQGVYSFCMCPGGIIAPCATNEGEIVTNGWSPSKRNNPYANSGIVTTIEAKYWNKYRKFGALAPMKFQEEVEQKAWELAGKTQVAPAQRMIDFIEKRKSKDLPKSSYQPGLKSVVLDEIYPREIAYILRKGLMSFGKKMKGYLTNEAVLVAPESRTSSPIRIPRNPDRLYHPKLKNMYPCGEGAGYAGGIVSAAIDGEKCADAVAAKFLN